jgi:hypothetical protein
MATGGSQTGFAPVRSLDCVWTLSGRARGELAVVSQQRPCEPSNELGSNELSLMAKSKSPSIGPMSVQPVEHSATARNQLPTIVSTIGEDRKTPLPKSQQARMDAVRVAKARIMRRNSLRKQRQAQKR